MASCGLAGQVDASTLSAGALSVLEIKNRRARDVKFGCMNAGAEAEWVGPQGRTVAGNPVHGRRTASHDGAFSHTRFPSLGDEHRRRCSWVEGRTGRGGSFKKGACGLRAAFRGGTHAFRRVLTTASCSIIHSFCLFFFFFFD
ncbi:hypothetical protein CKAH01_05979 [Colletotrichum kahawae]|uniref:Uncharacterized protein n=1 Tax=Colletotrichum kahawae TaxID=34407 RepID=A0AAD9YCC6_COLKA|nr:hypothetical protein CKAH01_05979 [Colletotrichum kahawae]